VQNPDIQVVTAYFDLGRQSYDGRTTSMYKNWLSATISLFPGIIVFHDKSLSADFINSHTTANFFLENLEDFSRVSLKKIEEISKLFSSKNADLVYQLPAYGILIHSKFILLGKAKLIRKSKTYLWVDAGYSRFVNSAAPPKKSFFPIVANKSSAVTIDLKSFLHSVWCAKNFNGSSLAPIGSSKRIIGGATISVGYEDVSLYVDEFMKLTANWVESDYWDTEQVALMHSLSILKPFIVPELSGRHDVFTHYPAKYRVRVLVWLINKIIYMLVR